MKSHELEKAEKKKKQEVKRVKTVKEHLTTEYKRGDSRIRGKFQSCRTSLGSFMETHLVWRYGKVPLLCSRDQLSPDSTHYNEDQCGYLIIRQPENSIE